MTLTLNPPEVLLLLACRRGLLRFWCLSFFAHRHAQRALHVLLYLLEDFWLVLQSLLPLLAPLAQPLALVREPGAALFDDPIIRREIEQVAFLRNAFAVHDVEFAFAERRRDFIFRDLHFRAIADDAIAVLDCANAANVQTKRRIEFKRATTGRGFGITKHHADLFANLVDEDEAGVGLRHDRGQFAQRLRHQASLKARQRIAHFTVEFRARHERRD